MTGLTWLASWEGAGNWPFCLTFVRGGGEDEVLRGFGADPREAVLVDWDESEVPVVRVKRSGDWTVALDESIPAQGTRPEVLRRVSAGTDAVAIYQDIASLNHEFAYAHDGEVIATVTTSAPPAWDGSNPGHLRPRAEELGLVAGGDAVGNLAALLALAEDAFGLSLDETDYGRSWPAAPILPVLDDLRAPSAAQPPPQTGDPVLDLLLARVTPEAAPRILSVRAARVIAEAGLGGYRALADAVRSALAGDARSLTDDDPAGRALRTAALDHPGEVTMLRFALAGRNLDALTSDIDLHRHAQVAGWRQQFITDLGELDIPAVEMRAAEEAARAQPSPVPAVAETGAVRSHVQALLDAGMDPAAIAEVGGLTHVALRLVMGGTVPYMPGDIAHRILAIEVPPRDRG